MGLRMNKFSTIGMLVIFITSLFLITGCHDGFHSSRPNWVPSGVEVPDPDVVAEPSIECVDVTNYKNIKNQIEDVEIEEDTVPNNNDNMIDGNMYSSAITVMATVIDNISVDIKACVKAEIKSIIKSGGSHYWGARTWLRTRTAISEPSRDEVSIVQIKSCEQVRSAQCLLVDH